MRWKQELSTCSLPTLDWLRSCTQNTTQQCGSVYFAISLVFPHKYPWKTTTQSYKIDLNNVFHTIWARNTEKITFSVSTKNGWCKIYRKAWDGSVTYTTLWHGFTNEKITFLHLLLSFFIGFWLVIARKRVFLHCWTRYFGNNHQEYGERDWRGRVNGSVDFLVPKTTTAPLYEKIYIYFV